MTTKSPKYKRFKAALDPEGRNWYENRNGNWSLTGFSALLNGQMNTVVFTAIGKHGKALRGGFVIALDAFVDVAVRMLAYLWDVPEDALRNLPEKLDHLERYRAAYESLDEALEDEPIYTGDEKHDSRLVKTLSAAHALASWRSISLAEFQNELGIEIDNEDEVDA